MLDHSAPSAEDHTDPSRQSHNQCESRCGGSCACCEIHIKLHMYQKAVPFLLQTSQARCRWLASGPVPLQPALTQLWTAQPLSVCPHGLAPCCASVDMLFKGQQEQLTSMGLEKNTHNSLKKKKANKKRKQMTTTKTDK